MNTLRPAEKRDIPDLIRLLLQVCKVHHDGRPDIFRYPATKYGEEELSAILDDPHTPVFVSCDGDGCVLGYAFCVIKETKGDRLLCDRKTLYIDDLCVDEEARGRGIGRELYTAPFIWITSKNCEIKNDGGRMKCFDRFGS